MELTGKIVITFNDIFPEEDSLEINEYLEGIERDLLIKFSSFIMGFSRNSEYENPLSFLRMYFSKENADFVKIVFKNLKAFVDKDDYGMDTYSFPFIVSSLSFFENAYDKDYGASQNYTDQEIEVRVFKAYLVLNKINTTDRTITLNESTKHLKEDISKYSTAYCLGLFLNSSDFSNYDIRKIFVTQTIRAISFFHFLEQRREAQELLKEFYKEYNVSNYQDYIKGLLPINISVFNNEKEAHTDIIIPDDKNQISSIEFLEKFSIKETQLLQEFDFINMRSTPIYRVDKLIFRLTYPLFVLELIGNGLYFKFKTINDKLTREKKIKDLYGLKTYEFSEKYILHNILKEYFGNRYFQRNGDELDAEFDGAPDYYVRNGKRIFLFESKDILINAKVKQSSDFQAIDDELAKKLYHNDEGKQKAVLQIINNVRKILSKSLQFDSGFSPRNVIIHPVLVLHNRIFNTAGLNKWVNFWFQDELEKLDQEGYNTSNVKPLVLIDIDTLIFNKDVFKNRNLKLEQVLKYYQDNYLNFTVQGRKYNSEDEAIQANKNSLIPFGDYLDDKIDSEGLRVIPREFEEKAYGLFD
ncbi:hypothetical protein [Yeosuana marina]|uniref:hypothetical protein n=1 Tax=Yeosuana marina TaxID=1565536 RepID=UPI0014226D04|nr:hypothetical protein [Yeosuana marina]